MSINIRSPTVRFDHLGHPLSARYAMTLEDVNNAPAAPVDPNQQIAHLNGSSLPVKRQTPSPDTQAPLKRDRPTLSPEPPMQVCLMSDNATVPKRGSANAAGFDLAASEPVIIPAKGKAAVHTGLRVKIPQGCYGRVAPRSGLTIDKFIDVGAGVIDADYRGEIKVILFNFGDEDFQVVVGKRIAQLVLEKISHAEALVVSELDDTERGANGFGSTGVSTAL